MTMSNAELIKQLNNVIKSLGTGELSYPGALAVVQGLLVDAGIDNQALRAKNFLASKGWNAPAEMGPTPPTTTPTQTTQGALSGTASQPVGTVSTLETATDPFTAYLSRLGIGGKTAYNPAEQYQVGLFDPLKSLYDIEQRLSGSGGPLQDKTRQAGTFTDFLSKLGGGISGLTSGAEQQLQRIFGATPVQKQSVALGYEPGQGMTREGLPMDTLDPGKLSELQDLFKFGLRSQTGPLGAYYAAQRLPQAQQAYYSQKASGGGGQSNFLDWLRTNWGIGG